ncbi:hypothetical protein BJ322DRAFT_100742 [Thelephora terrestris]|uniref:Zinc finger C2H2 LYAR-type domain-containing protein n=1 Tax=Thelephora terrestris TaxID=56493 RepID=A0A9P6LC85_9AGAM|nr:hypothetical protein BJ322DRAFT_100742 [Thelephora terrestris]
MVSFQCNACADVLTKPKLDKHQTKCRASFDCIDCSKRFETPADYKGHTSCISEAEKYEKGLYNGGKQGGPEMSGRNNRSWKQGGGRQWGNNRGQWPQRSMNQATGANETPLGTPVRMSPVSDAPVVKEEPKESEATAKTPKKRKAETEPTESKDISEPVKKKKKKQKAVEDVHEATETTEAKITKVETKTKHRLNIEVWVAKSPSRPEECGDATQEVGEKKTKKKKKGAGEEVKKKEKRKTKEDPSPSGQELESAAIVDTNDTLVTQTLVTEVSLRIKQGEARSTKKSKSKESKSKLKAATEEAPCVTTPAASRLTATEAAGVARDDQGHQKKRRHSGNHHEENGDATRVSQGNKHTSKEGRKEKKKKHKSGGQTASTVE